jgi:hypothetical protein
MKSALISLSTKVFSTDVSVMVGQEQQDGTIPLSAILKNGTAFSRFLVFDTHTGIVSYPDADQMFAFMKACRKSGDIAFTVLRAFLSVPYYLINLVTGIVRGILGSFIGFGLIGMLIVLVAIAASLMVGLYGFIIAAPFLLAVLALDRYEAVTYRKEGRVFLVDVSRKLSDLKMIENARMVSLPVGSDPVGDFVTAE